MYAREEGYVRVLVDAVGIAVRQGGRALVAHEVGTMHAPRDRAMEDDREAQPPEEECRGRRKGFVVNICLLSTVVALFRKLVVIMCSGITLTSLTCNLSR